MKQAPNPTIHVFVLNPESGELRFGDGTHGARLPNGAVVRVDYDYGAGRLGNVNEGEINTSPVLPAGIKVTNPVRTWGGAEAEEVTEGEKQITRYLQHRDRLVSVEDFETIVRRTPGVDINRVEVIPAFNPELLPNEPGDAPGAVTILVIPQNDPEHPDAPVPDRPFLDAICRYVNPRRLVTTELFLQGPEYVDIWVSMGIEVRAGESIAQVREAVKKAVVEFLSPLDRKPEPKNDEFIQTSQSNSTEGIGWPLRKSVVALELVTVASRVPGLLLINEVIIAKGAAEPVSEIPFAGLQLPRVRVTVTIGPALPLDQIRGPAGGVGPTRPPKVVAVPVIPEECK
jgi:predicted phage baseplate assembly protein